MAHAYLDSRDHCPPGTPVCAKCAPTRCGACDGISIADTEFLELHSDEPECLRCRRPFSADIGRTICDPCVESLQGEPDRCIECGEAFDVGARAEIAEGSIHAECIRERELA